MTACEAWEMAEDIAADKLAISEDKDEAEATAPLAAADKGVAGTAVSLDPAGNIMAEDVVVDRLAIPEDRDEV